LLEPTSGCEPLTPSLRVCIGRETSVSVDHGWRARRNRACVRGPAGPTLGARYTRPMRRVPAAVKLAHSWLLAGRAV
jgi:hypothetical protein